MTEKPDEPIDADVVEDETPDTAVAVPQPTPGMPFTPVEPITDYTESGEPTFDYVRDKIEGRVATSIGSAELAGETRQAADVEDAFTKREQAGKDKLEEIRRAMREGR
jgi:hypothetical protein